MVFRPAQRKKAKLRLGIAGPAGSGKTYSAILIAKGLGGKIAMVDTENGSGDLFDRLADYDVETLGAPFDPGRYIDLIHQAEKAGYSTVILDSISHAWAGAGGLLDQQNRLAKNPKVNSFTAWRDITPKQTALIDAMLQSSCNIIATMRSKQDYIMVENDKGKQVPQKVGMAPVQRDGMDYEFTICFDLSVPEHYAIASKDRTSLFDGEPPFLITADTGKTLLEWLEAGVDGPPPMSSNDAESVLAGLLIEVEKITDTKELHRLYKQNELTMAELPEQYQQDMLDMFTTQKEKINDNPPN